MGSRRGGREDSPLAGLLRRSPREREVQDTPREEEVAKQVQEREFTERAAPQDTGPRDTGGVGERRTASEPDLSPGPRRDREVSAGRPQRAPKKRGRPRGGRRSNPEYVQISARIHRDVRFSLERVLLERSEREGRYVEMAEVIEDLMRFYVENGDPYSMLDGS